MAKESLKREVAITSFGGVGGSVSGSCHFFESGDNGVVVDMGTFQGRTDLAHMRRKDARDVYITDYISENNPPILASHSHLDHIGFIPIYFLRGHRPDIFATKETAELMEVNLMRSAKFQRFLTFREDFSFGEEDVREMMRHVQIVKPFEEVPVTRNKKIKATFCPNGHTLNSCSIILKDEFSGKRVLFSGDVGRPYQLLSGGYNEFSDRYPQDPIDVLVTESTCFQDQPIPFKEREATFHREIKDAFSRGGLVLMPFIQDRYLEYLEIINKGQRCGEIPSDIDCYRDGPALIDISNVCKKYPASYFTTRYGNDPDFYNPDNHKTRFRLDSLYTLRDDKESKRLLIDLRHRHKKSLICASGGMLDDGRASNYVRSGFFKNPENTAILSCFQVDGTVGAELLKQQHSRGYRGARVVKLEGGSSHATGPDEIFGYHQRYNLIDLKHIIIVHGEKESRESMEKGLRQTAYGEYADIRRPDIGERVNLN